MIWNNNRSPRRIFVVEGRQAEADGLRQRLAGNGAVVVFLKSGQAALQAAREGSPAIWLIHVSLPDMAGTELHHLLRQRGERAPVALVADDYSEAEERAVRAAGVELYWTRALAHQALKACR